MLASVIMLSSPSIVSADDLVKDQATSEVTITSDGDKKFQVTTTNRRYETDVFGVADGKPDEIAYKLLLIEQSKVSNEGPEAEPETLSSKIKVTAYPLTKEGKGAADFTIETTGVNQDEQTVCSFERSFLVPRRP